MDSKYDLQTGDLLLFSQKGSCLSTLIEKCTQSKFSHVAIILKNPTNISPELKGYYILESSIEIKRDTIDNKKKFGVRIRKLKDAVTNYKGTIYWRKLNCLRDDKFYLNIKMLYEDVRNILYDVNPVDWFKAAFGIDIGNVHKKKTFWCFYTRIRRCRKRTEKIFTTLCAENGRGARESGGFRARGG